MTKSLNLRPIDLLVISDIHLGTYGCHSKELLNYLKSVVPNRLVLNGDIIDIWQFNKHYWPKSHMKIVRHILSLISKGTEVYYITGNHDEMLRKFVGFELGNFKILNKLVLELEPNVKSWFFHGDVFDVTMQYSRWITRLGTIGYDSLIVLNKFINFISKNILHRGKISLSKKIKERVKSAVSYINDFENVVAGIGIDQHYNYVVCGHIHNPEMKIIENNKGKIIYLNSGDWIENLSALEYQNGKWQIFRYNESEFNKEQTQTDAEDNIDLDNETIFSRLINEFQIKPENEKIKK